MSGARRTDRFIMLAQFIVVVSAGYWLFTQRVGTEWRVVYLVGIGVLATDMFLRWLRLGVMSEGEVAESLHALSKALNSGPHEYVSAGELDLDGFDVSFYDSATSVLKREGFRQLGDVIDATMEQAAPESSTVIRCLLDRDGVIIAAIFDARDMRESGILTKDGRTVHLETELSDGRFVQTTNGMDQGLASEAPGISRRMFGKELSIPALLEQHRKHLTTAMAGDSAARPVHHGRLEDVLASHQRLEVLQSAHRNSAAFDVEAEFGRIAGGHLDDRQQRIVEHWKRLRARDGM